MNRPVSLFILVAALTSGGGFVSPAAEARKPNIDEFVEGMKSGDKAVRRDASYRLSQLGPDAAPAVPELIKGLEDNEDQVWFNSITALARIGPAAIDALPALMKQLEGSGRSRYREQRWYRASFALGSLGPQALPALIEALRHDRDHVRSGAAKAIGWMGPATTDAIAPLVGLLGDSEAGVREEAAGTLGKIGPAALPALTESLESEHASVRASAALALEIMGDPARATTPQLIARFKAETDDATRAQLMRTLSRLQAPGPEWLPQLIPLLKSGSENVRQEAANAIILMPSPATTSVPALEQLARSSDAGDVQTAVSLLGAIGSEAAGAAPILIAARSRADIAPEAATQFEEALILFGAPVVPDLVSALTQAGGDAGHWSLRCLRDIGPAATPVLITSLKSKQAEQRRGAIQALTLLGKDAELAVPDLVQLAKQGKADEKGPALIAAAGAGAAPDQVIPLAEAALMGGNVEHKRAGAQALALLGARSQPAQSSLIKALADGDDLVVRHAAHALGLQQAAAAPAVAALGQALGRGSDETRIELTRTLGQIGAPAAAALPQLLQQLSSTSPELVGAVAETLGELGDGARSALPEIKKGLTGGTPTSRSASLLAFARIESNAGARLPVLREGLKDESVVVRGIACAELGKLGRAAEPASDELFALLESSEDRPAALEAIREIRPRKLEPLMVALKNVEPEVRMFAAERIGQLGKAGEPAVPVLRELLEDGYEPVRGVARSALREIQRAR